MDPLADAPANIGTSSYAYVWNNPLKFIDPDGRHGEGVESNDMGMQKFTQKITDQAVSDAVKSSEAIEAIHFVYESITREIFNHTVDALASGQPSTLHYIKGNKDLKKQNRREALKGFKSGDPSPDEYPYACTYEGGCGASVRYVQLNEQKRQGGQLSILSRLLDDKDAFIVVPIPEGSEFITVMKILKAKNKNMSNTTTTRSKRTSLQRQAVIRTLKKLPRRAASRLLPPVYLGPGSGFN